MGDLGAPDVVIFGAEFDEKGDGNTVRFEGERGLRQYSEV